MAKRAKLINGLPPGFKVIHVLPDGTEVDSVKGMRIPYLPETHGIYELVAKYAQNIPKDKEWCTIRELNLSILEKYKSEE